ncbi:MAG: hypothetical protein GF401_10285 [Chitinivibrionales bacterium]|nr:hypothetical protein [Chitinivibrionales bacterium]
MKIESKSLALSIVSAIIGGAVSVVIGRLLDIGLFLSISGVSVVVVGTACVGMLFVKGRKNIKTNNGIVPITAMYSPERLPGEVFMAELLELPVIISKDRESTTIEINRKNVKDLVVSNAGKTALAEKYAKTNDNNYRSLDRKIHRFISDPESIGKEIVPLKADFRLRWASGGVLSIVTFRGKNWIPLFFRDIKPYGWNVALGSSERHFDKQNRLVNNLNHELMSPERFICREFLEETLVIQERAKPGENTAYKMIMPYGIIQEDEQNRRDFKAGHVELREQYDSMRIHTFPDIRIKAQSINSGMVIKILPSSDTEDAVEQSEVLVCFNLLETGIEVVKLLKYTIGDDDEILDGEILDRYNGRERIRELTRMPVGLLSCEFLNQMFSKGCDHCRYTPGIQPSVEIPDSIPSEHIHLFEWDVKKRFAVVHGDEKGEGSEKERYREWYDKFGENFFDSSCKISTANPSRLFTPATAKILHLFFSCTEPRVWQVPEKRG